MKSTSEILKEIAEGFGGTAPNAFRVLSRSDAAVRAFHAMMSELSSTTLTDIDREVIAIAVAMENDCQYCTTAHEKIAKRCGASEADIDAIISNNRPLEARSHMLVNLVNKLYQKSGRIDQLDLADLAIFDISEPELLEIIMYVSAYQALSFVTNNWGTPIDPQFR